jgi:hypothetical protein
MSYGSSWYQELGVTNEGLRLGGAVGDVVIDLLHDRQGSCGYRRLSKQWRRLVCIGGSSGRLR